MAKHRSPKRVPQRPLAPPDGPQQPPDMSDTPPGTEQGQRRRYEYRRRTQPSTTRRTKPQLIDREGQAYLERRRPRTTRGSRNNGPKTFLAPCFVITKTAASRGANRPCRRSTLPPASQKVRVPDEIAHLRTSQVDIEAL
jgi:hypothetical protein